MYSFFYALFSLLSQVWTNFIYYWAERDIEDIPHMLLICLQCMLLWPLCVHHTPIHNGRSDYSYLHLVGNHAKFISFTILFLSKHHYMAYHKWKHSTDISLINNVVVLLRNKFCIGYHIFPAKHICFINDCSERVNLYVGFQSFVSICL